MPKIISQNKKKGTAMIITQNSLGHSVTKHLKKKKGETFFRDARDIPYKNLTQ